MIQIPVERLTLIASTLTNCSLVKLGAVATVMPNSGTVREELRHSLTLLPKDGMGGYKEPLYMYHLNRDGSVEIPRALIMGTELEVEHPLSFKEVNIKTRFPFELDKEQRDSITQVLNCLCSTHPYGGILQAPTGAGKSVMAMRLMESLKLKILIIVPRTHLIKQWIEGTPGEDDGLLNFTDLKRKDIGIIQGPRCEYKNKKVVIGMLHSLSQKEYPEEVYSTFGLVIPDEVHTLGAQHFSKVASMFDCKYRIGLTATPRRKDGTAQVFFSHIGPIISSIKKLHKKPRVLMIPYKGEDANQQGMIWRGRFNSARYFNRIMKLSDRNIMLATLIESCYKTGRDIFMVSDRREQVFAIKELLLKSSIILGKDIGLFIREQKDTKTRVALGTYGTLALGTNLPKKDTMVIGTPRVDVEQLIGRILRKGSKGKEPLVLDVVDSASSIMRNWAKARLKFYQAEYDNVEVKGIQL